MSTAISALLIFIGIGIAVWLISFIVEALRPVPKEPRTLAWAPDIPIEHLEVGGKRATQPSRRDTLLASLFAAPSPSSHTQCTRGAGDCHQSI